jgi:SEC-C motif
MNKIYHYFEAQRLLGTDLLGNMSTFRRTMPKIGRNEPCPCGSGKKFKQCCGKTTLQAALFIIIATALFPAEDQQANITGVVHAVWSKLYREKLPNQLPAENAAAKLADIIRNDHAFWEKYPNLAGLAPTVGSLATEPFSARAELCPVLSENHIRTYW